MYVQALLEVYNKYSSMVESSFSGDSGFFQSLDRVRRQVYLCTQKQTLQGFI